MSVPILGRFCDRKPLITPEVASAIADVHGYATASFADRPALRVDADLELLLLGFRRAAPMASDMDLLLAAAIADQVSEGIVRDGHKNMGHKYIEQQEGFYFTVQLGRRVLSWANRHNGMAEFTETNKPYSGLVVAAGGAWATATLLDAQSNRAWRRVMRDYRLPLGSRSSL